jgi:hypothetical protein
MTARVQTDRLDTAGQVPATGSPPGTLHANLPDRQLFASSAAKVAEPLLSVRFFDVRSVYKKDDIVATLGMLAVALSDQGPGAFDPAQWAAIVPGDGRYLLLTGGTLTGPLIVPTPTLDTQVATLGAARALVGVAVFSSVKTYVKDALVSVGDGNVYRAKGVISPGAFNPSQWLAFGAGVYLPLTGGTLLGQLTIPPATAPDHAVTRSQVETLIAQNEMPIGAVVDFAMPTAPEGWLSLQSTVRNVSRGTYGALYQVIGTLYGPGDGSTTFGLPPRSSPPFYPCIRY